jgi:hypothetical protein
MHEAATLAVALIAVVATAATAGAQTPFSCTTNGLGSWTVTARGPSPAECDDGAACLEMTYEVTPNNGRTPTHIAVLVGHDTDVATPGSSHVSTPCQGDPVTKMGLRDCSRKSVTLALLDESGPKGFRAFGTPAVISSSVVLKKGNVVEECRIASLGSQTFDPNAQLKASEQIVFKGCTVTIPVDPVTGEPGTATIQGENCVFVANADNIATGELLVNGKNVGTLTYGEGSVSSGEASCTTKVISRKIYTWCTCADVNGDNIPDDPKPPCPATLPTN